MSTNATARQGEGGGGGRLDFIDVHRGLAVVWMIWMHSADAWLRPELKTGATWDAPWNLVRSLGGLAAPTFLLLAGVSCGIGLWRAAARQVGEVAGGRERIAAVARDQAVRGLQIVVLGYALRLQMWMIDAGGARLAVGWLAGIALALGYVWAYQAIARAGEREPVGRLALQAAAALAVGFAIATSIDQPPAYSLVRVDVLQAIGTSIVIVAALHRPLLRWPWLGALLGVAVAIATHYVRAIVPGILPVPLAAYLAQWPPPPGRSVAALFPLFPWLGYALIGASMGQQLAAADARGGLRGAAIALVLAGIPLALLGCEPLAPAKAAIAAFPASLHVVRVVYRVGASLLLMGIALALARPRAPFGTVLRAFGQASLFVYWAHLQLTFGALAKPLAHELDFRAWALGFALLTMLMAAVTGPWVTLRKRLSAPRALRAPRSSPEPSGS